MPTPIIPMIMLTAAAATSYLIVTRKMYNKVLKTSNTRLVRAVYRPPPPS